MKTGSVVLNTSQKRAVLYHKGPLLVIAGAGTGKTSVIVEKVTYLIGEKKVLPESILALTFTEKAAFEMETRIDKALPYGYFQMWISTFHAFADRILRQEAHHIGIPAQYTLMTEAETIIFFKKHLFLFELEYFRPLGNPHKFLTAMLQHFSRLRDEDISPRQYALWVKRQKGTKRETGDEKKKYVELARAYDLFQTLKLKERVMDFADLLYYLLVLFRRRPHILAKYRHLFRYGLVDEFQDTNIAQYELIKLLFPPSRHSRLTVVGDDSQAIYKFRGASVSNILQFMKDYPDAKEVTLSVNYRSTQSILDRAYALITHNNPDTLEAKLGISKRLTAKRQQTEEAVRFREFDTVEQEATYTVSHIEQLAKKRPYRDFAILLRANSTSVPFMRELARRGVPYQFLGPGFLFRQPEIKDLIAYLKILTNLDDSTSLYRVLSMDVLELNMQDIHELLSFSRKTGLSLFHGLKVYVTLSDPALKDKEYDIYRPYLPSLQKKTKEKLMSLYKMIGKHLNLVRRETAGQILYYFLEDTGFLQKLVSYHTVKEEKIAFSISRFFNRLKTFESEHEDVSVFALVDYIDMSMELGESPLLTKDDQSDVDAVNLLTVHAAKGLEFPVVFIPSVNQGKFPTQERREAIPVPDELVKELLPQGNHHEQEERRLFYVAVTRAKDLVFVTASRFSGEAKRERKVSRFIPEMLGESYVTRQENIREERRAQLSIFDYKKKEEKLTKLAYLPQAVSFSQIETYERCPLQYKYRYVLGLPATPSQAASFGDTIHRTLQAFYQLYIHDRSVGLKKLLYLYQTSWVPIGYQSPVHERERKKEGERMLRSYFHTFHTAHLQVIDVEQPFKIKLGPQTVVTGKIDRVDKKPGGGIEIIDYKTGKKPTDPQLKNSLQLSLYARAAMDKGVYNKPLDKIELTFFFLQDGVKVTLTRTPVQIAAMKTRVEETMGRLKEGHFEPKVGIWCDYCPFKMICEAWQ